MILLMQKAAIERRLHFYESAIPRRQPAYGLHKMTKVIPKLKRALQKIEEGTYGVCEGCECEIPEERLKVIPGALCCVSCQKEAEVRERRR